MSACKRNSFHERGTISMVTKWRIVWFQTGKVKSTKKLYENEVRKKYGRLFRQTSCLRRPRYLLRSFSSVLELVFMDTIRKWRAAAVLTSVLFEGKVARKMRNSWRRGRVSCAFRRCGGTSMKASAQMIVFRLITKIRKWTKTSMLQRKKKKTPNPLVCSCIAERFSTSCRVPATVNQHKPT